MPTDKRQRQKQGRVERLAAERAAAKRAARRRRVITTLVIGVLTVGVVVLLSQLGGADGDDQATDDTTTTTAPTTVPAEDKPVVTVPEGDPPTELQSTDLRPGDGAEAVTGSNVEVNYVGVAYSTGEEFDTSYGKQPFSFELGASQVIPGWDQGVVGMKVGGQRQLVIPPDLAYGEAGQGESIGPNETLIFVIELLGVA